jgi:hypothetical protein
VSLYVDHRIIAMAAALTGIFTTSPLAYADESETSTDQEIKQRNVGSGDSNNNNCAENEIYTWATAVSDSDCQFNNSPPYGLSGDPIQLCVGISASAPAPVISKL